LISIAEQFLINRSQPHIVVTVYASPRRLGFNPWTVHVRFVVKMALGQVYLQVRLGLIVNYHHFTDAAYLFTDYLAYQH
jgi:hypothetical protein